MNNNLIKFDDVEGKVYEIDDWKSNQAPYLKNHFSERLKEIKKEYDSLLNELNWNKVVYESNILFEPVVGREYYLYKNKGKCRLGISLPKAIIQRAHDRNRLRRIIRNSFDDLKNESVDLVFLLTKNLDQSIKNDAIIVRDQLLKDSKTILLDKN